MSGQHPLARFIREAMPALALYALVIVCIMSFFGGEQKPIELIQSTGFLLAAFLASYFAWLNLEGARKKRRDDLFDKRFQLYERLIELYYSAYDLGTNLDQDPSMMEEEITTEIFRQRYKAKYIFGDDIFEHCDILINRIKEEKSDCADDFDPHAPFVKYLSLDP